jgi:hypothetical protein
MTPMARLANNTVSDSTPEKWLCPDLRPEQRWVGNGGVGKNPLESSSLSGVIEGGD